MPIAESLSTQSMPPHVCPWHAHFIGLALQQGKVSLGNLVAELNTAEQTTRTLPMRDAGLSLVTAAFTYTYRQRVDRVLQKKPRS